MNLLQKAKMNRAKLGQTSSSLVIGSDKLAEKRTVTASDLDSAPKGGGGGGASSLVAKRRAAAKAAKDAKPASKTVVRQQLAGMSIDAALDLPADAISNITAAPSKTLVIGKRLPADVPEPDGEFIRTFDEAIFKIEELDKEGFISNMHMLSQHLEADDPHITSYVSAIYENLYQYEELAHLLTEEQIGIVVRGVLKAKGANIKTTARKTTSVKQAVDAVASDSIDNFQM